MKKFWKVADTAREDDGWAVRLDGKSIRTPARAPLKLPTEALARAVAGEWAIVGERIDPRSMPLTGLANAAIDRVAPGREAFADGLARYAETDLLCYRADGPRELADRQSQAWDALLVWARRRFDVDFTVTEGIVYVPQARATVDRLAHAVGTLDPFRLAGLSPIVTVGGSLVAALAVIERAVSADAAWEAVTVDDAWQRDQWGADAEAEAALDSRRRDFFAGARFLELLDRR